MLLCLSTTYSYQTSTKKSKISNNSIIRTRKKYPKNTPFNQDIFFIINIVKNSFIPSIILIVRIQQCTNLPEAFVMQNVIIH